MKLLWIVLAIAGCGGSDPSCKDAVQRAAKTMYGTSANRDRTTMMIGKCEQDEWSAAMRSCISEVTDEPGVGACLKKYAKRGKDHPQPDDALAQMEEFARDICACRDKTCADHVTKAMTRWGEEMAKSRDQPAKVDDQMAKRMADVTERYVACMSKLTNETTTALAVNEVEPANGDADGGTYVRLVGIGFTAEGPRNAKVYFGARQGTIVRFASDSELIVQAPGGKVGETVDVLVIFDPGGERKLPQAFTFVAKM